MCNLESFVLSNEAIDVLGCNCSNEVLNRDCGDAGIEKTSFTASELQFSIDLKVSRDVSEHPRKL